jgi:hypothetical protein
VRRAGRRDYKRGGKEEDDSGLTRDDHIILRMKRQNPPASWKAILEATNSYNNLGELKGRFRVIQHQLENGRKTNNAGNKKDKKWTQNADREEIHRRKREEGLRRQAEVRAAREAEKAKDEDKAKEEDKKV